MIIYWQISSIFDQEHTFLAIFYSDESLPSLILLVAHHSVTQCHCLRHWCWDDRCFFANLGLDYVSHDDVLPYTSTSVEAFHHELFPQFFVPTGDSEGQRGRGGGREGGWGSGTFHCSPWVGICLGPVYIPRDILGLWREKNHDWLELGEVHRETTLGVRVTVMPFFMGHKENIGCRMFWWRYNVRIENLTDIMIQLKARQWRIYSVAGTLETVKGKGVIGQVTNTIERFLWWFMKQEWVQIDNSRTLPSSRRTSCKTVKDSVSQVIPPDPSATIG